MRPPRRLSLALEPLEGRQLLSAVATQNSLYQAEARVQHKYHQYVSELQHLELKSQATPAQYLALRDDARAISAAATPMNLTPQAAQQKATLASLQLDRAPLNGSLNDQQWVAQTTKLTNTLFGLNIPPALIDQTINDMRAIADSAGVSLDDYNSLAQKADSFQRGRDALPSYATNFPDPTLYYTQHLRGFFRGGADQRARAQAKLNADLASTQAAAHDTPAQVAELRRDVIDLEQVGGYLTTAANQQLDDAFVAAFAQGAPTASALTQLGNTVHGLLGPNPTSSIGAAANRLLADAPTFFQAAGSSPAQIATLVQDVRALVAEGGGSPLNPFKIQVSTSGSTAPLDGSAGGG